MKSKRPELTRQSLALFVSDQHLSLRWDVISCSLSDERRDVRRQIGADEVVLNGQEGAEVDAIINPLRLDVVPETMRKQESRALLETLDNRVDESP